MALKIVRLAAADYGNGRRRCPQALPAAPNDLACKLITRGSRRKSYIPAVTAPKLPHPTERHRCTEKRHSTQYFWTPPPAICRNAVFWPTGVHFYCTSGRLCGHLSECGGESAVDVPKIYRFTAKSAIFAVKVPESGTSTALNTRLPQPYPANALTVGETTHSWKGMGRNCGGNYPQLEG